MIKIGNMALGVVVGFLLITIIGWIPIIGALIAGLIAGAIARGTGRGLVVGFVSGILSLIFLILLAATVIRLGTAHTSLIAITMLGSAGKGKISSGVIIVRLILIAVGGLIGGALRPRRSRNIKTLKHWYNKRKITKRQYEHMKSDMQ